MSTKNKEQSKKKESFWDKVFEHIGTYGWAYLIVLVAIGALVYFDVLELPKKFNPEIHICFYVNDKGEIKIVEPLREGYTCTGHFTNSFTGKEFRLQKRDKTPQELEIDYCNENPDDSERCFCEEWKKRKCLIQANYTLGKLNWTIEVPFDNHCFEITETEGKTIVWIRGETIGVEPYEISIKKINLYCIKVRPKTECEKGNPDFVEETIKEKVPTCYDIYSCTSKEGYQYMMEFIGDFNKNRIEQAGGTCIFKREGCEFFEFKEKTICREKTEVEKLMDKDCDWLFDRICFCNSQGTMTD